MQAGARQVLCAKVQLSEGLGLAQTVVDRGDLVEPEDGPVGQEQAVSREHERLPWVDVGDVVPEHPPLRQAF